MKRLASHLTSWHMLRHTRVSRTRPKTRSAVRHEGMGAVVDSLGSPQREVHRHLDLEHYALSQGPRHRTPPPCRATPRRGGDTSQDLQIVYVDLWRGVQACLAHMGQRSGGGPNRRARGGAHAAYSGY